VDVDATTIIIIVGAARSCRGAALVALCVQDADHGRRTTRDDSGPAVCGSDTGIVFVHGLAVDGQCRSSR
jgi:hypothetical protein